MLASRVRIKDLTRQPLLDFVPAVSPRMERPVHLLPIVEAIERALKEETRAVISAPPQHGKTSVITHGVVWHLARRAKRNAYVTYEAGRGQEVSLLMQQIASESGIQWDGNRKVWHTAQGGQLIATGIGGPLTGYGIDGLLVVDDPVKNRLEAESATFRERTHQWFRDVALTRVHPGASVLVVQTRWHPDDLAGRLIGEGWPVINLPALSDGGEALWPERRPLDWLLRQRQGIGEYTWASLYQGQPRPRGGAVFGDVHLYDAPPRGGYRVAIGVDLAYSARTSSDYSVALVLAEQGGVYYILDVKRMQVRSAEFASVLEGLAQQYPTAPMRWYGATTERGAGDLISDRVRQFRWMLTRGDKFIRSQPVAAAWNTKRVLVPNVEKLPNAKWVNDFVTEVAAFTGIKDAHDDMVDALAAAFDALDAGASTFDPSTAGRDMVQQWGASQQRFDPNTPPTEDAPFPVGSGMTSGW